MEQQADKAANTAGTKKPRKNAAVPAIFAEKDLSNSAENRLLDSALRCFSEKGYDKTSIREIIEGAGVTRPVLYYYFTNKEELFTRVVNKHFSLFLAVIDHIIIACPSCKDRLKAIMRSAFQLTEENMQELRIILQVFFSPPEYGPRIDKSNLGPKRFRFIEKIMQDGLDNNELSGGDARSLTMIYIGIMDIYIMAKSDRPEIHLTAELAESLIDFFFEGAAYRPNPQARLTSPLGMGSDGDSVDETSKNFPA